MKARAIRLPGRFRAEQMETHIIMLDPAIDIIRRDDILSPPQESGAFEGVVSAGLLREGVVQDGKEIE